MNNKHRSLIASVLAVAMLLSLAACGGGGQTPSQGGTGTGGKSGKDSVPEFVYVSSFEQIENNNTSIGVGCFTDTGFYTTGSDIVGQEESEDGYKYDVYAENLSFVSYDGKITKLEGYKPLEFEAAEGHDIYTTLNQFAGDGQGNITALYHVSESWIDAPEGMSDMDPEYWNYYNNVEKWYLRTMDSTGAEISLSELDTSGTEWFYPYAMEYSGGKKGGAKHHFSSDFSPFLHPRQLCSATRSKTIPKTSQRLMLKAKAGTSTSHPPRAPGKESRLQSALAFRS